MYLVSITVRNVASSIAWCFLLCGMHVSRHVAAFPNQAGHCESGAVLGELSEGLHGYGGGASLLSDNHGVFLDGFLLREDDDTARAIIGNTYRISLTGRQFKGFLFRLSESSGMSVEGSFSVSDPTNVQECPPCSLFDGVAGVCHTNPTIKNEISFLFTPESIGDLLLEVTVVVDNTGAQSDEWYYSKYSITATAENKVDETDSPTIGPTSVQPTRIPTSTSPTTEAPTSAMPTPVPTKGETGRPTRSPSSDPPTSPPISLRPISIPVLMPTDSSEVFSSTSTSSSTDPKHQTEYIIVADLPNRGGRDECLELRRGKTYSQNKYIGATCGRERENGGQHFFFEYSEDGEVFALRPKNDVGMCTEVYEARNKAWLHIGPCRGNKSTQRWKINRNYDVGDGFYAISPVDNDDFVVTNLGVTVDNGDPAMLKTYEDATNAGAIRKWRFDEVK